MELPRSGSAGLSSWDGGLLSQSRAELLRRLGLKARPRATEGRDPRVRTMDSMFLDWEPETHTALSPGWEWKILAGRDIRRWSS